MAEFNFLTGKFNLNNIEIYKDMNIKEIEKTGAKFFSQFRERSIYEINDVIWSSNFSIHIKFDGDNVYEINLKSATMFTGDDIWFLSEAELLNEKKNLTEIILREANLKPLDSNTNPDIYEFDWGYVSICADFKASTTSLSIIYNDRSL